MSDGWITTAKAVPVAVAAAELGLTVTARTIGPCPACGAPTRGRTDRRAPIDLRPGERWVCRACDAHGDVVDLVSHLGDPREWFVAKGWVPGPEHPERPLRPIPPPPPPPPSRHPTPEVLAQRWAGSSPVGDVLEVRAWLDERRIPWAVVAERDLARAVQGELRLPLWGSHGDLVSYRRRLCPRPEGGPKELALADAPGGVFADLTGRALLRREAWVTERAERLVYLTEGGADYLARSVWCGQDGPPVLGFGGATSVPAWLGEVIPAGWTVVVDAHRDQAGEQMLWRVTELVRGHVRRSRVRDAAGKDLADGGLSYDDSESFGEPDPEPQSEPNAPDEVARARAELRAELIVGQAKAPRPTLEPLVKIFGRDPTWRLQLNEQTGRVTNHGRTLDEASLVSARAELEGTWGTAWRAETAREAAELVARRNAWNPVVDYLGQLPPWDGQCRLDGLLVNYMGAEPEEGEDQLYAAFGRCTLIALVARALVPGCKVDHVTTLQGPQGYRKSTALRSLVPDVAWFHDDEVPIDDDKRVIMVLRGPWLVELADFSSVKRSDIDKVKAFVTRPSDRGVPMFGREVVDNPRRCVIVASVNDEHFLAESGRRWWVVRVRRRCDTDAIVRDRDQLFAEALHRYRAGEPWHLPPELEELQDAGARAARITDPTEDAIGALTRLAGRIEELWLDVQRELGATHPRPFADLSMADQRQFGSALRKAGWRRPRNAREKQSGWRR